MFDCAIAGGRPVPDGRLISRIADEVADRPPDAFRPASAQAPALGLLELLSGVAGGRPGQGRDHPVAAVLCGNTAIEDVTAWVHAAPRQVLAAAGARRNALGVRVAPHPVPA